MGVAGLEVQVELARLRLFFPQVALGELLFFGQLGDAALLNADVSGGGVEPRSRRSEGLIGPV